MGLKPTDMYLIAYNAVCCAGWTQVWVMAVDFLFKAAQSGEMKTGLESVFFCGLADYLIISQLAALLEIVHAAAGLVRSPVMVTTMQVMSRVVVLFAAVFSSTGATQYGAGLMILAWASVEVPRYAFYICAVWTGDATKGTPFPLFWLRYSLFALLYPLGIFGEITVCQAAVQDEQFAQSYPWAPFFFGKLLPVVYFFGSPFMIFNMYQNRVKAFKKRFAKPPPPPRGVSWPKDENGERSSTNVNKAIMAAAVGAVNKEKAQAIENAKGWRFGYVKHLASLVEEQCKSPEAALKIAQAGLDKAYDVFEFIAPDGTAMSFRKAMEAKNTEKFYTGFIKGEGKKGANRLEIPYDDKTLRGDKIKKQVREWVDYGTIEPSAGEAIISCVDHPEYLDLSDRYFVLLGAGSAMGPFLVLMSLGANVIAVDLDRDFIWRRLIKVAKNFSGSITFPLTVSQDKISSDEELYQKAGCNLFTHTPMIRDWLMDLYPGENFTIGNYAYLDGARHVQVSLAMDAVCRDLSEKRKNVSLAYLCTPTDLHLVPKEAYEAAKDSYKRYSSYIFCKLMRTLSKGKFLRKNYREPIKVGNEEFYLVNGVSVAQGPNYALAKRMQHWRAIIARSKGCTVSSNIAPSTSTVSVVHNRTFAWAYEGMPYFEPYEIFAPETSNAVMSAILLWDLNDPKSAGNPKNKLSNPNQLFSWGSFHGGLWRAPYEVDSIGETSVLLYFWRVSSTYIAFVCFALVCWTDYCTVPIIRDFLSHCVAEDASSEAQG